MKKVSIIGAGHVGATCAYYVAEKNIADIVLVDVVEGMPQAKGLDFCQAAPLRQYGVTVTGTNDYAQVAGSDVVVITAGVPRKPGMDRMDLLKINTEIVKTAARNVAEYAPNSTIIVVSNPLDIMCMVALDASGFALKRVFGMAGILDSTRFRWFVAEKLGVSVLNVQAMVLGGHGDTMVPLPRFTTVNGIPITELMSAADIEALSDRTRNGGAEIVKYLKTGSAFYAPAASAAEMVEAVLTDEKRIQPCAAYLRGEYGHEAIYLGVPVLIGANGAERIIELDLSVEEKAMLDSSAEAVHEGLKALRSFYTMA
ncbi:MAG: malate dehydrogenase [Candidatus Krumholzibacteriia bacterium]|nr:malate dehydrogenase [bacterium]MCB9516547.1 malate dehydrogenase [Candidatus Latescibacterota bacterium]